MVIRRITMPVLVASVVALGWPLAAAAQRTTLSLDGTWSVAEGIQPEEIPPRFDHQVAVPGLTNQARPAFPDVDRYETHEFIFTMKNNAVLPKSEKCEALGRTPQKRNYFWYERTFTAPARRDSAVLVVNKAQFGTAVWLNGQNLGEHLGCFTAGRFDATAAMNWSGENRLLIRIGAHPARCRFGPCTEPTAKKRSGHRASMTACRCSWPTRRPSRRSKWPRRFKARRSSCRPGCGIPGRPGWP